MKTSKKKIRRPFLLAIFIIGVLLIGLVLLNKLPDDNVACTLEAKLCPDGSSVGRIPPTCEFASCPGGVEGQEIIWDEAKTLINDCEVKQLAELHSGFLNLTMIDGSLKIVKSYSKEEYENVVKSASEKCLIHMIVGIE